MNMFIGSRICQIAHLLQEQRILEDALNGLDQIRFQGAAVLLLGIASGKELLQSMVALIWKMKEIQKNVVEGWTIAN